MEPKTTAYIHMLNAKIQALTDFLSDRLGADDRRLFDAELRLKMADAGNEAFTELNKIDEAAAAVFLDMLNLSRSGQAGGRDQ